MRLDGAAVRSCLIFAVQAARRRGRRRSRASPPDGPLTPLQEAFRTHHGLQCGFCTAGILMSAQELVESGDRPTRQEIRELLSGHLCRCTGYAGIVEAIAEACGLPPEAEA